MYALRLNAEDARMLLAFLALSLLALMLTPQLIHAQMVRASPGVIIKILGYNISAENLSKIINSVNASPVLGGSGLSKLGINSTEILKAIARNPKLVSRLSPEEAAKLSSLTSQLTPHSRMPSSLKVDLSALASMARNKALKKVLEDWAVKGEVNISELRSNVNLNNLSTEDLTILKSALGLALKYGLIDEATLKSLGLSNLSPQDLRAFSEISRELAGLNVGSNYSVLWSSLAEGARRALSLGNLTPTAIDQLFNQLSMNRSLPFIARIIAGGLSSLSHGSTGGISALKSPQAPLPSYLPVLRIPRISLKESSNFIEAVLGSIAVAVAAYIIYMLTHSRVSGLLTMLKRGKGIPKTLIEGGVNSVVINYWKAVAILSRLFPIEAFETHREYLNKIRKFINGDFSRLTKLYEVARWSGRGVSEEEVKESFKLLSHVKECVKRRLGVTR